MTGSGRRECEECGGWGFLDPVHADIETPPCSACGGSGWVGAADHDEDGLPVMAICCGCGSPDCVVLASLGSGNRAVQFGVCRDCTDAVALQVDCLSGILTSDVRGGGVEGPERRRSAVTAMRRDMLATITDDRCSATTRVRLTQANAPSDAWCIYRAGHDGPHHWGGHVWWWRTTPEGGTS